MKLNNFSFLNNPVIIAILGVLVVLSIIRVFDIAYPIEVTTRQVSSELSVTGEGKVDVVPDTASVQVGIVVNDEPTVAEVETQINEINNNIVAAMTNLGIAKEDIKTTNYSINPNYRFDGTNDQIQGYNGNATLTIKVRSTDTLPQVITGATEAGANQVYDTQYTVDDPAKYREEARNAAIENAKEQAKKLADQLGIKLGNIVNIVESSPQSGPVPMYDYAMERSAMGGAPELQPGSQTISSTVTLYFEKK